MNPGPTILLIDDNEDVAKTLAFVLNHAGYQTYVTTSGPDGMQWARRFQPSLVISDLEMPEMRGNQVLAALRNDPLTARTPVILTTGYDESVASGMKADAVLTKPFDVNHVIDVVRALLAKFACPR